MMCCAVLCAAQCHAWLCCSALGWCPPDGLLLLSCCFDAAYCSAVLLACYCAPLCCDLLRCSGLLSCAVLCCCCALLCSATFSGPLLLLLCLCCCCWRFSAPLSCYFVAKMRCTPISCFFGAGGTILLLLRYVSFGILEVHCMNTSRLFCGFGRFPFPR